MDPELMLAGAGAVAGAIGGGFWGRRSKGERDANSAVMLTKAYGEFIDDLRKHMHRQDGELKDLRDELRSRDVRVDALQVELASVQARLAAELAKNETLTQRIAALEAGRRSTDS
jgi:chromosome segregation ATPase